MKLSEYENNIIAKFDKSIHEGKWTNEGLVELFILIGEYLNLKTVSKYAEDNNMTYSGAERYRNMMKLFGVKFIIENN